VLHHQARFELMPNLAAHLTAHLTPFHDFTPRE
jgi:hypothetical protein